MKKSILFLCTAAALTCGLSSCQKDNLQPGTLSATMEDLMDKESKVIYDGSAFAWQEGDRIKVCRKTTASNSSGDRGDYIASLTATPNKATFTFYGNESTSNKDVTDDEAYRLDYYAFYPNDIYDNMTYNSSTGAFSSGRAKFASSYRTDGSGHLLRSPMFAVSSTKQLQFKHLGGLLRLQLQKEGVKIVSIKVSSASKALNGKFTISLSDGVPSTRAYSSVTNASKSVSLALASPIDITTQQTFFIPLPAADYTDLTIELTEQFGGKCTKTQSPGSLLHIERGMYSTINLGEAYLSFSDATIEGAKGGLFSVSASKQVRFSRGNLQYLAAPTATWRFAPNQYDVCPTNSTSANLNPSDTSTRWIDMFGWGTSGYKGSMPYNYLQTAKYGPVSGPMTGDSAVYDWGHNAISNGGNQADQWRTLTSSEWNYLFGTNATRANKWARAKVNGQRGLMVLPDAWPESGEPRYRGAESGNWETSSSVNDYTAAEWAALEAEGAVFLPQCGYRETRSNGTTRLLYAAGNSAGNYMYGHYWLAHDRKTTNNPPFAKFSESGTPSTSSAVKYTGLSVRLVHEID